MKTIKWLISLANGKPILLSVAMLLIAVSTLTLVITNRDARLHDCEERNESQDAFYQRKFDSLGVMYSLKEDKLNAEVKATLNTIIESYKLQLTEQKTINERVSKTLNVNRQLINKNTQRLR